LYIYLIDEYINANINNSPQSLENAVRILSMMRETWADAIVIVNRERESAPVRRVG
jgi:flagellar protein FliS